MRFYLTFLALSILLGLSLIYIKQFGIEEYVENLMKGAINYAIAFLGGAIFADLLLSGRDD